MELVHVGVVRFVRVSCAGNVAELETPTFNYFTDNILHYHCFSKHQRCIVDNVFYCFTFRAFSINSDVLLEINNVICIFSLVLRRQI